MKKSPTAEDAVSTFELLADQQQKEFLWKLAELENQYDDIEVACNRIHNKPTALQVLKMFDSENILN